MNPQTRSAYNMFGAYCGLYYVLSIFIGWGFIAGFLPPHSPSAGAEEIAEIFRTDTTRIRIGMVIVMYSAFIFIPFAAIISRYISKIEGEAGVLTYTNLLGGAGNMVLTFYPAIWWLATAYRPDRSPELIHMFNDLSWLQLIGGASMWDAMPLSIALAAFADRSPNPVFPRWAGYVNIFIIMLVLPDQLLFFFHGGPFSWEGIFGLWIPVVAFGGWFLFTAWLIRRAILRERAELQSA